MGQTVQFRILNSLQWPILSVDVLEICWPRCKLSVIFIQIYSGGGGGLNLFQFLLRNAYQRCAGSPFIRRSIHMEQGVFSMFQGMGFIILIVRTHPGISLKYSGLKLPPPPPEKLPGSDHGRDWVAFGNVKFHLSTSLPLYRAVQLIWQDLGMHSGSLNSYIRLNK